LLLIRSSSGLRLIVALVLAAALVASWAATPAAAQTDQANEQDAGSGDAGQSGTVTGGGDNSNQCVGLQPVTNTGDAQTQVDVIIQTPAGDQYTKRINLKQLTDALDNLDLKDIGSSIEINPQLTVQCAQEVNQAATASDTSEPGFCSWVWDNGYWCLWSTDGSWWAYDDGSYYPWSNAYWYAAEGGWWWYGSSGWWWWDGYNWTAYGAWNTASNVAAGTLDATGGLSTLGVIGVLGLGGTALVIRRTRTSESE
jgi:hypothetical protein